LEYLAGSKAPTVKSVMDAAPVSAPAVPVGEPAGDSSRAKDIPR